MSEADRKIIFYVGLIATVLTVTGLLVYVSHSI